MREEVRMGEEVTAKMAAKNQHKPRYAIVTPVRDEEDFIGETIESIAWQTIPPSRWIIVDDGSRDRTAEIVRQYERALDFLELIQLPPRDDRAPGGEGAVPTGLRLLEVDELDYVARFDADITFPPDYIEDIIGKFDADPQLGIAGGVLYVEQNGAWVLEREPETHVRGALKMYRRACFEAIGKLDTRIGWDTLDEVSAWSKGWKTRSFKDIMALHRRPTGVGIAAQQIYRQRGRAEYLTWSHPAWVLGKAAKIAVRECSLRKAGFYLWGFVQSYVRCEERVQSAALIRARRREQLSRMARFAR